MKTITWPKPINRNSSTVGVVSLGAPEAAANPEPLARGIAWLEARGHRVVRADHLGDRNGFLSAAPNALAADLRKFVSDPSIDWIIAAGGGANANHLLSHLDYELLRKSPKALVGMSNMSVVLNAITAKCDLVTFHGPAVIWNLGQDGGLGDYSERHFWDALAGKPGALSIGAESSWQWIRAGRASGRLMGGNLWSIQQLVGTQYWPDLADGVLFIEDCFCELHQVDAILTHLRDAGILAKLGGLVVGVMEGVEEKEYIPSPSLEEIVLAACSESNFPILSGVRLGHTPEKVTLPVGGVAELDSEVNRFAVRRE